MIYAKYFITAIIIILAIYDIKYREIPVMLVIVGILVGTILNTFLITEINIENVILSIIPALFCIILYFIKPSEIGLGDGLSLLISELGLSLASGLRALFITSISVVIVSVIIVIMDKKHIKLPFVLFIALGHIVALFGDINIWEIVQRIE